MSSGHALPALGNVKSGGTSGPRMYSKKNKERKKLNRSYHFPKEEKEEIHNPYKIGQAIQILSEYDKHWLDAHVVDKQHNWVVVHYKGYDKKYNQRIHVVKRSNHLRVPPKTQESKKRKIIKVLKDQMGFPDNYIHRAIRLYEKKCDTKKYEVSVIAELICLLQNKDAKKNSAKDVFHVPNVNSEELEEVEEAESKEHHLSISHTHSSVTSEATSESVERREKPRESVSSLANNAENLCIHCFQNPPTCIILPCAHLCLCEECSTSFNQTKKCPICHNRIGRIYRCAKIV